MFLCAVLRVLSVSGKWDDTVAPISVVAPAGNGKTYDYHMAHFGGVPYGTVMNGCAYCMAQPAVLHHVALSTALNT